MVYTFFFFLILAFLKSVYSVIYFVDLDDKDFIKFCHDVKTTSNVSICNIYFKPGDNLDIFQQKKLLWSSEKHHNLDSLVILSKSERPELLHIIFKESNSNEVNNVYFCRKEETFISIEKDDYYKISASIKYTKEIFDVNLLFGDWFKTFDEDTSKIHYFDSTIKILQVVDGRKIIWNNEKDLYVLAIKMDYGSEGPEKCEIFTRDKISETRDKYFRDDLGWHHIITCKYPVEHSKLKIPSPKTSKENKTKVEQDIKEGQKDLQKGEEGGVDKQKVLRRPGKYELIISLDETNPYKLPNHVDVADYYISGFDSRIYDCGGGTVTRVSDGNKLLWYKTDDTYLEKVTILQCPHSGHKLLEIQYVVKSDQDLGVVKGLKPKNWMNVHYYEYDYYSKYKGDWESMKKIDFQSLRQRLINDFIYRNRHIRFDSSVGTFFDDVSDTPLSKLDTRKLLSYKSFKEFKKTYIRRYHIQTISMVYNLQIDPETVFTVNPHCIFQNFILCTLEEPYGISRFMDGEQILWNQGENGIGMYQFYYYIGNELQLLHLNIDAKYDKNKYFHKRKDYWYEIEEEEYMKLLNNKIKTYKNKKFEYKNNNYILVDLEDKDKSKTSEED